MYIWLTIPKPSELFCLMASLSLQLCLNFIVLYVAILSQPYSALLDSLHTRTQPYTTTYQPYSTHRSQLVAAAGSEITARACFLFWCSTCNRVSGRLFHSHPVIGLFRCCLFVGFIMSMVCLLAGIASARPSAFVEGAGFEPAMSYTLFAAYPRHYPISGYSSVAFDHSAILPFFVHFLRIFAQAYLSIFRSSYNPSAMFCAI